MQPPQPSATPNKMDLGFPETFSAEEFNKAQIGKMVGSQIGQMVGNSANEGQTTNGAM